MLNRCNEEWDLGILFYFQTQIQPTNQAKYTLKANSVIDIIKRSFGCLDKTMVS